MTNRDRIWAAIRARREFTRNRLYLDTRIRYGAIADYLNRLERAEIVERIGEHRRGEELHYRLVNDVGVETPRLNKDGTPVLVGRCREHMWRSMRILGDFSVRELAVHGSTEEVQINFGDARTYVQYLNKAGYLAVIRPGKPNAPARYRLLPSRYTGPKPPQVRRIRQVFDPNLGRVVWPTTDDGEGGA